MSVRDMLGDVVPDNVDAVWGGDRAETLRVSFVGGVLGVRSADDNLEDRGVAAEQSEGVRGYNVGVLLIS